MSRISYIYVQFDLEYVRYSYRKSRSIYKSGAWTEIYDKSDINGHKWTMKWTEIHQQDGQKTNRTEFTINWTEMDGELYIMSYENHDQDTEAGRGQKSMINWTDMADNIDRNLQRRTGHFRTR